VRNRFQAAFSFQCNLRRYDEVNAACAAAVGACVPYTVWLSLRETREMKKKRDADKRIAAAAAEARRRPRNSYTRSRSSSSLSGSALSEV
jgi:hypothetical protein